MKYTLGLDIGIASIGWCVLDEDRKRIAALGVRTFKKAEHPKTGASLALPRRQARSTRRRIRRRRHRLERLRSFLVRNGLLSREQLTSLLAACPEKDPYQLRTEGLDRKLSPDEWVRTLYHLAGRRGFQSNRRQETGKEEKTGLLLASVRENSDLLREKGYQTVGEMLHRDPKFSEHKRNRQDYSHTISRKHLLEEITTLFDKQRRYGNPFASEDFEKEYVKLFSSQRPYATKDLLLSKVGRCTFEPSEYRAPKRCYSAERFELLQKLANLRISSLDGRQQGVSPDEREKIIEKAHHTEKVTFKDLRQILDAIRSNSDNENKGAATWTFVGLRRQKDDKSPETRVFAELKGYHTLRKAVEKHCGKEEWKLLSENIPLLNNIAWELTYCKDEESLKEGLLKLGLQDKIAEAFLDISFSGNKHLSLKALFKIIPFMEQGLTYDKACAAAGYDHTQPRRVEKTSLLPPLDTEDLRNPVVLRALSQTRKVVNTILRRFGHPAKIHVETARDLSKPYDERRRIEREQEQNRSENEKSKQHFRELFGGEPTNTTMLKFRLWKEQGGTCPYSLAYIEPSRLLEPGYAEVDHILPFSRSLDDGWFNKVLVKGEENRNKGNRTPYEYFGNAPERWEHFSAWVYASKEIPVPKKNRLLREVFNEREETEMRERNLNDTRYISRFFSSFIRNNLLFPQGEDGNDAEKNPVMTLNGRLTAFLRARWGLIKDRDKGDLHHALDAAVIAATSWSFVQNLSTYYKTYGELPTQKDISSKKFPQPYPWFRDEVKARLAPTEEKMLQQIDTCADIFENFGESYDSEFRKTLQPIFVSRAPCRRVRGKAHKETLRGPRPLNENLEKTESFRTVSRVPLEELDLDKLERMVGKQRDRKLYQALLDRLNKHEGNGKKAFQDPFFKPCGHGQGHRVRHLRLWDNTKEETMTSGVPLFDGDSLYAIAEHDDMVRVDVYEKTGKISLVPVYVADIARKTVKNRAIVQGKAEAERPVIDGTYTFLFSLFPSDLVEIRRKDGIFRGYYVSCDRADGRIILEAHDRNPDWGKKGQKRFATRTDVLSFKKFHVDPLGEVFEIKNEKPPFSLS